MNNEQLTIVASLRAREGKEDELGRALMTLLEPSRLEPGCVNYDVHQSNDDAALWVVYENWRSRADLDAHLQTPHMAQFVATCASLLASEVDMRHLSMRSAPARR